MTVDPETMRRHKRARFHICRELWEKEESVPAIAARLKVTERTVQRYLRDLEGHPRKPDRYAEWMPLVLAHLKRFPTSWFTDGELSKVLLHRDWALGYTLRRMEREGLVVSEPRSEDARGRAVPKPVSWYRLAHEDET